MTPAEFTRRYIIYFGAAAPLPLAVLYSDAQLGGVQSVPGCMFKQLHRATCGETVTLHASDNSCRGGKFYTGLAGIPEYVYEFVSNNEKYKSTPEVARHSIDSFNVEDSEAPYLNFVRVDCLESFDNIEGVIFLVNPDVLSGLFSWANYDCPYINAVLSPWGSGCSTTVTSLVNENRKGGKHCFIGMLDVSARPFFKPDVPNFSIPKLRLTEMLDTLSDCCVATAPAWQKVKKRINRPQ